LSADSLPERGSFFRLMTLVVLERFELAFLFAIAMTPRLS
jgi:hypothetical protein